MRSIPDPDPGNSRKKEREEYDVTHAQYRSWCLACVTGIVILMKHPRSADGPSAEGRLHTLVMDDCLPLQGSQQVLSSRRSRLNEIDQHVHDSKAIADFTSGCGCSFAILESDGEPAIVALQEAMNILQERVTQFL